MKKDYLSMQSCSQIVYTNSWPRGGAFLNRSGRHADVIHIMLQENRTVSLEAGPGSRFVCVSGGAWLTQDGDLRDYVLLPGAEFCCASGGQVVVTSIEPVSVFVFESAARSDRLGQLHIETIELLLQAAKMARSKQVGALAKSGVNILRDAFHRISRVVRATYRRQFGKLE